MNQRFIFLGIGIVTLATVARAEVKPQGTIITTSCGENTAPAGERNRAITEVCLANVQGEEVKLVVIESLDAKGKALPTQVLPIVSKQVTDKKEVTVLTLGTTATTMNGKYQIYTVRKANLLSEVKGDNQTPQSISGYDLSGHTFKAKLSGVVHTQSLE